MFWIFIFKTSFFFKKRENFYLGGEKFYPKWTNFDVAALDFTCHGLNWVNWPLQIKSSTLGDFEFLIYLFILYYIIVSEMLGVEWESNPSKIAISSRTYAWRVSFLKRAAMALGFGLTISISTTLYKIEIIIIIIIIKQKQDMNMMWCMHACGL